MLLSQKLSPAALAQWCRALKHGSGIGLPTAKLFRQQARSGPAAARPTAAAIAERLEDRQSLADAVAASRAKLPALFVELVAVGEEAGRVPEAFEALEVYFDQATKARRTFLAALIYPGFTFVAAVLVVALMLLLLGILVPAGGQPFDALGLGLTGPRGAIVWLAVTGGLSAAAVVFTLWARDSDRVRPGLEANALGVPLLGPCFKAFALERFSMALHMTAEAGIKADRAVALSLRATANRAYAVEAVRAGKRLRGGRTVTEVVAACRPGLFPDEFKDAVEVGETSGQLAEVMTRQAGNYRDEAARRTLFLAKLAGGLVMAGVGLLVIIVIARILMSIGGVYADAMKGL